jgi:hypothetical protein
VPPDKDITLPFEAVAFSLAFRLHPEATYYNKIILHQWFLDILSSLGGYFVFITFVFRCFCM